MNKSHFDTLPSEVHSAIIHCLSLKDLIYLYQVSHYWRHKVSHEKPLWRSIYEHEFGSDFSRDDWILWALRRLWSQSPKEEERLAARHVNLTVLDHLDAYTWFRLVRGRFLTEKNWRNNTPQRTIIFNKKQLGVQHYTFATQWEYNTYGIFFVPEDQRRLGFAIIDDTLNNTQSNFISEIQKNDALKGVSSDTNDVGESHLAFGNVGSLEPVNVEISLIHNTSSQEFFVAGGKIRRDLKTRIDSSVILVWDIGHLEVTNINGQECCVPRLCMTELLPFRFFYPSEHQGGWLLIGRPGVRRQMEIEFEQYILYDLRRRRLAASFELRNDNEPVIGKATPDQVQIYHSYTELPDDDDDDDLSDTGYFDLSSLTLYQYHYCNIEVSVKPNTEPLTPKLFWPVRKPTRKMMEPVIEKYRLIQERVNEQAYWCDEGYQLNVEASKEEIRLPIHRQSKGATDYLRDDLFLTRVYPFLRGEARFIMHSPHQRRILWSEDMLSYNTWIPDEKVVFSCYRDGTVRLIDGHTGSVSYPIKLKKCKTATPVIGPLCAVYGERDVLVDLRTGKEITTLAPNQLARSLLYLSLRFRKRSPLVPNSVSPVTAIYIDQECNILIDEYGQI
jgi:hypothetical protein